jgi:adenylate cyclase
MAFWVHEEGSGTPREVLALFDSIGQLARIVEDVSAEFEIAPPLAFGVGVNSGLAVTGNMGSAGLADHTAMGDAVNKAFRLETATKEVGREILVGKGTFQLLSLPTAARSLFSEHTVHLKGYEQPEQVHGLRLSDLPDILLGLGA